MTGHDSIDPFADWDAAYVLGSLSPTDRRDFERHLPTCEACTAAVAELAGMPGLLGRVPAATVEELVEFPQPVPVPSTLLPRLVRSVQRRRRTARLWVAGGVLAAAAATAAVVLTVPLIAPAGVVSDGVGRSTVSPALHPIALRQVVASPLSAAVSLVARDWGTRLDLECRYAVPATPPPGYRPDRPVVYSLVVTDAAGRAMQVATWEAAPGSTVEPSGTTSLAVADIRTIEIRATSGAVLMRAAP